VVAVALASCRTAAPPAISRMPDPVRPPGVGAPLSPEEAEVARAAVAHAEIGEFAAATKALGALPPSHPVRQLAELEVRFLAGEAVAAQARIFAASLPGYGSAWGFATIAARREGDLRAALTSARRAAELQPDAGWGSLIGELEQAQIAPLLAEGHALLQRGDAQGALTSARQVLDQSPNTVEARYLAVRAMLELHNTNDAAEMVPGLPDSSEGLELKGSVALALGQWELALEVFTRLPSGYPHRCQLVETARRNLRFANAPPYVTVALGAKILRRGALAAIVAAEVPSLAERASGPVSVFEDVVQLPESGDIIAVARSGVIPGDVVARRFNPEGTVSPNDLADALERLAKALGRPAPRFCRDRENGCVRLPEVIDGQTASAVVRQVTGGGGDPCPRR
jgi:tetratricopeptide (TPR) repeat protein